MALTDIPSALAQYTASLPWQSSLANAQSALDAVRYLLINRGQNMSLQGVGLTYESLENEKKALEQFLGATAPRSFGRSRRVSAAFSDIGGLQ